MLEIIKGHISTNAPKLNGRISGYRGGGSSSWSDLTDKPFETLGRTLKVTSGVLDVNTSTEVEQDNTLPITSAAVYTEVGNINALLGTI